LSGPGGSMTVWVAEIGLAGAAGMAETGDSTTASGPQAESSGGFVSIRCSTIYLSPCNGCVCGSRSYSHEKPTRANEADNSKKSDKDQWRIFFAKE